MWVGEMQSGENVTNQKIYKTYSYQSIKAQEGRF
jgi:hypothetical protein